MAKEYLEIVAISAVRGDGQQFHSFAVTFDGPMGAVYSPCSVDGLIDYQQFQREVLSQAGILYVFVGSEGRDRPAANEAWKKLVVTLLNVTKVQTVAGLAN